MTTVEYANPHNRDADRYRRLSADIHAGIPIPFEDQQWLLALHQELENAISWDTTCLNCSHMLDSCYAETARREQMEAEFEAGGLVSQRLLEKVDDLEVENAVLKETREWSRRPKPFFQTDFNVRRAGNRLVAYTDSQPEVIKGDVVIVGAETVAVLARVHDIRQVDARGQDSSSVWAIEVDWTPEHWS